MDWKKFIKPDWRRLLFFAFTMGGLNYWWIAGTIVLDARVLVDIPLDFYPIDGFNLNFGANPPVVDFSWLNFILDIMFWYLFACVIFYSIDYIIRKIKGGSTVDATP